jgi:AraC-like DNA-binding protein
MVAKDPQQTADTILAFLMGVNGARSGAIYSVGEGLRLFVGHRIGQDTLEYAKARWLTDQESLRQGRLSRSDDRFLVPILKGERLVAIVFLTAHQLDLGSIAEVAALIGEATLRSGQPATPSPVEEFLEKTPAEEIERRKLLILLERYEWNVARVARELQVTRTTIYKRLESFGISRKRVLKDRRVGEPLPTS